MSVFATILSDSCLSVMLLLSMMIAAWWGELAGIRPGRDKSGLGGFAAIYLFLPLRWLGLAILMPSWAWLGVHTALGALSAFGFARGVQRVQNDREVPVLLGLLGALLAVPALWVDFTNVHSLPTTGRTSLLAGTALLALHSVLYLRRRRDLRRVRPPTATAADDGAMPFK